MRLHVKHLLIGGGIASIAAARAIREIDKPGSMLLIGQEISRPYQRALLSGKYLLRQAGHEELFLSPREWFVENDVEIRTGRRGARLDVERHSVLLDDGQDVAFDNLLIATGASAQHQTIPGSDLPNLFYLRTIEDADRLHNGIQKARAEGRPHETGRGKAAIIGGELLAVELASTLSQCGLAVDLLVPGQFPWEKIAGEATGRFAAMYLEKHGVRVHLNARPRALEGDGRVQRVRRTGSGGETMIECDLALSAAGSVPNKDLIRGTSIAAEQAILTDDRCGSSAERVFAAGDCAAVFDPRFGKHRIIGHWEAAEATGRVAGINMAGGSARFEDLSHFTSRVFDLELAGWGEPRVVDHRIVRGNTALNGGNFVEIGVAADGRIAQVLAVNHPADHDLFAALVAARSNVNRKEERLKDPAWDLRGLT